jgi:hypothetical protein
LILARWQLTHTCHNWGVILLNTFEIKTRHTRIEFTQYLLKSYLSSSWISLLVTEWSSKMCFYWTGLHGHCLGASENKKFQDLYNLSYVAYFQYPHSVIFSTYRTESALKQKTTCVYLYWTDGMSYSFWAQLYTYFYIQNICLKYSIIYCN